MTIKIALCCWFHVKLFYQRMAYDLRCLNTRFTKQHFAPLWYHGNSILIFYKVVVLFFGITIRYLKFLISFIGDSPKSSTSAPVNLIVDHHSKQFLPLLVYIIYACYNRVDDIVNIYLVPIWHIQHSKVG